jgi:hypothetical protein
MTTDTTINAAQNPDLANKLAAEAINAGNQEIARSSIKLKMDLPPDTVVELPAGLLDPITGHLSKTAEVRELTGADEEAISKILDVGKSLLAILDRAVLSVGNEPGSKEIVDSLLSGDREMLLLAIRKVTFGAEVKLGPGPCPSCSEDQIFTIDLDKDVPVKELEGDREFIVDCKIGKVLVGYPSGSTQKDLINSSSKTVAELDSIMLKHCIREVNGEFIIDPNFAKTLGMKDRRTILEEIGKRNPGPQLNLIKSECGFCGSEVPLPLTLADLFRE